MPRINARPVRISADNPPPAGPTGYAGFKTAGISSQDLANGVCIIADRYQGGPQTVRAAMAIRYKEDAERFFAISEEPVYDLIQIDDTGKYVQNALPVLSITSDIVVDADVAALIARDFCEGKISIEYCIKGRTAGTYTRELKLLADAIVGSEDETEHGYTLVIDNGDSSCKRRRHGLGHDSKMIASIADLIAREVPTTGFIYSSSGPGNAIIEALRRCRIPVGKKISETDAINGFSAMTTPEVKQNWDKAFSHLTTDLSHAWKYDRNTGKKPALLDLSSNSAIMVDPSRRENLRSRMTKKKVIQDLLSEIASIGESEGTLNDNNQPASKRVDYKNGNLTSELRKNKATNACVRALIIGIIYRHDIKVPGRPNIDDFQSVLSFAMGDYVTDLARRVSTHYSRGVIRSYAALAAIIMMIETAGGNSDEAISLIDTENSPFAAAGRRINGYTKAEKTPQAMIACFIQAWNAHVQGHDVERFHDNVIPAAHTATQTMPAAITSSNDNAPVALAA